MVHQTHDLRKYIVNDIFCCLYFSSGLLQINDNHREILIQAMKQLVAILSSKKLYPASKKVVIGKETAQCTHKLEFLSVQHKFTHAVSLEISSHLWNQLLLGFHPGQLSFIFHASSDTLVTAIYIVGKFKLVLFVAFVNPPTYNYMYVF